MPAIARALPWAIAMLLLAVGEAYGFVAAKDAQTMYIILPILALLSIIRPNRCATIFRRGKGAAQ